MRICRDLGGLGDTTGARILAELGDDRERFTDARAVKAYAGSAPVTRASGKSISVTHRRIKNDRLAAAGWIWAFCANTNHPAANQHYRRRDLHGDRHPAEVHQGRRHASAASTATRRWRSCPDVRPEVPECRSRAHQRRSPIGQALHPRPGRSYCPRHRARFGLAAALPSHLTEDRYWI